MQYFCLSAIYLDRKPKQENDEKKQSVAGHRPNDGRDYDSLLCQQRRRE
jgi:hypothetical protein